MNMMQGACFFACSNYVAYPRCTDADEHFHEIRSGYREKRHPWLRPAMARASSVLPVPGEPTMSTPFGILPPSFWNLPGSFKKSTISTTSCFASSTPRDIGERNVHLILAEQTCAALAEGHCAAAAGGALHLAHEVGPEANENQYRERRDEQLQEHPTAVFGGSPRNFTPCDCIKPIKAVLLVSGL